MDGLLYTAASGASRVLQAQAIRAENLGNIDTAGFRSQMERARSHSVDGVGFRGRTLVSTLPSGINLNPSSLTTTGRDLDFAIQGEGMFTVKKPDNTLAYTRNGSFEIDTQGFLTLNGLRVQGLGGDINVPEYGAFELSDNGLISITPIGGNGIVEIDQLRLVNPPPTDLKKDIYGLIVSHDEQPIEVDPTVMVVSGFVEESNVSPVTELVDVMSLTRNFEMQLKMMRAADELAKNGNKLISSR